VAHSKFFYSMKRIFLTFSTLLLGILAHAQYQELVVDNQTCNEVVFYNGVITSSGGACTFGDPSVVLAPFSRNRYYMDRVPQLPALVCLALIGGTPGPFFIDQVSIELQQGGVPVGSATVGTSILPLPPPITAPDCSSAIPGAIANYTVSWTPPPVGSTATLVTIQ
jgi:hypothetical protein